MRARPHVAGLLLAVPLMSLAVVDLPTSAAVPAAVPHGEVSWQSAGDSYSSGEGVFGNVGDCAQSDLAYGPVAVERLGETGWDISSTFTACTSHLVEDYFNPRQDSEGRGSLWDWGIEQGGPQQPDIITMSFGGNDIGFADVIKECLIGLPDSWGEFLVGGLASSLTGCDISEEELTARVDALLDPPRSDCTGFRRTGEAGYDCTLDIGDRRGSIIDFYYDVVTQRLSEHGQLYIVGYPRLIAPVDQWPGWIKTSCQGVLRGDSEKLGRVSEHLNMKLNEAVRRVNQALGEERVHFLDRLALFRDGKHELCGTNTDWLNGIAVDRGEGLGVRLATSFHPNADGHSGTADALVDLVSATFAQRLYTDVTEFAAQSGVVCDLDPETVGYPADTVACYSPDWDDDVVLVDPETGPYLSRCPAAVGLAIVPFAEGSFGCVDQVPNATVLPPGTVVQYGNYECTVHHASIECTLTSESFAFLGPLTFKFGNNTIQTLDDGQWR